MSQRAPTFYFRRRHLLFLVLIVVAIYVLLPQFGGFRSSWYLLRHPMLLPVLAAIALACMTYVAAAGTLYFLAFKRLSFGLTLLEQLAANLINRLLPAGIGALGVNYLYLRHERHTVSQAGSVVASNNLLGFVGHGLLVLGMLLVLPGQALTMPVRHTPGLGLLLKAAGVIVVVLVFFGFLFGRQKFMAIVNDVKKDLLSYRHRLWSLAAALVTSMVLTTCNVLCLFFCLHALSLHLPFTIVLLVFTFGLTAGSAIPTPGGLGGFEAGLAAGLVTYGVAPSPALAAALLYRFVSYWLPLVAGAVAFIACQHMQLFAVRPHTGSD